MSGDTSDPRAVDAPFAEALDAEQLFVDADVALPDPEFAARLRRRVAEAAGVSSPDVQEATMTTSSTATAAASPAEHAERSARFRRPGSATITPYLIVHDARAAIDWYHDVFGAEVTYEPIVDGGRIGHVELTIGGTTIQMADEWPDLDIVGPLARGGPSVSLTIYVPDVDATYALAVERGAVGEREPADQFYGSRTGYLVDPFGHRWGVQTYLGDDGEGPEAPPAPVASGTAATQAQDLWDEVGYYVLNVPELEPALRFYGELLGWRFAEPRPATEGTGRYAHVESSTVPFGIHGGSGSDVEWDPYLRVRDLRSMVAKVRELGGTVESEEYGYESGGNAVCRDDQGVRFQLWQPAEGY
jgi:uncharacterized glyoxalase superfamily protein PhnB